MSVRSFFLKGLRHRLPKSLVRRAERDERAEAGKASSINREFEVLRRALRLAHDRQLLPSILKVRVLTENNNQAGLLRAA